MEGIERISSVDLKESDVMSRRWAEKILISATVALLSKTLLGQETGAASQETEEEELPVFRTMEEWEKSPLLADKAKGLIAQMRSLNEAMHNEKTYQKRKPLHKKTDELVRTFLLEVANPLPPSIQRMLLANRQHGLSSEFATSFRQSFVSNTDHYPLKILAGRVNGRMAVSYIQSVTKLPFSVMDEVTEHRLLQAEINIGKEQAMWETLATVLNASKTDIDVAPLGGRARFDNNTPLDIALAHLGPWSDIKYTGSKSGIHAEGRVVRGDGRWNFIPPSGRESDDRTSGYYLPEQLVLQGANDDEVLMESSQALFPLVDSDRQQLLELEESTERLRYRPLTDSEKKQHIEAPSLLWREPWDSSYPLDEWYARRKR